MQYLKSYQKKKKNIKFSHLFPKLFFFMLKKKTEKQKKNMLDEK